MKYTKIVLSIVLVLIVIDFIGFVSWKLSQQTPQDSFYAGVLLETILN